MFTDHQHLFWFFMLPHHRVGWGMQEVRRVQSWDRQSFVPSACAAGHTLQLSWYREAQQGPGPRTLTEPVQWCWGLRSSSPRSLCVGPEPFILPEAQYLLLQPRALVSQPTPPASKDTVTLCPHPEGHAQHSASTLYLRCPPGSTCLLGRLQMWPFFPLGELHCFRIMLQYFHLCRQALFQGYHAPNGIMLSNKSWKKKGGILRVTTCASLINS